MKLYIDRMRQDVAICALLNMLVYLKLKSISWDRNIYPEYRQRSEFIDRMHRCS